MNILERIVETKRAEVAAAKRAKPVASLQEAIAGLSPPREFAEAVTGPPGEVRLIAEIKKSSPSAGLIVEDFDPVLIARIYADHGAAAISVLTDETYFQGKLETIARVKQAVPLPVLRKDFLFDAYQVYEARAADADAVLLIAEVLDPASLQELAELARTLSLGVLVEVHDEEKLAVVLGKLGPPGPDGSPGTNGYVLGINNRDLTAQRTDLSNMSRLAAHLPAGTRFVAESGIADHQDIVTAREAGACAVLVGESLLKATDIGAQIDLLMNR